MVDFPPKEDSAVVVTFTTLSPPYGAGDSASFDKATAKALIDKKLATLASSSFLERSGVFKSKAATELEDELAKQEPEKKAEQPKPVEAKAEPAKEQPAPATPPQPGPSVAHGRKGNRR